MHDKPTDEAMVTPNCVKNEPLVPDMNITGMNTAMKTSVHEMTATVTSDRASRVALSTFFAPSSSFAITASVTTMASSTTVPMASTRAKRVRMFSEKPATLTMANVPSSDTMMLIEGISVARKSCRKKNTTRITRMMAMMSVSMTECMAAFRKSSLDISVVNFMPGGSVGFTSSSSLLISAFTAVALAPGA